MLVKNCARFGWHSCLSHGEFAASRQRHSEPTTVGCLELASWNIGAEKQASYLPGLYCLHSSFFLKVHLVPNIKWSRHDVGILHERSSVAEPDVGSVVSEMTKQLQKPNLVRKNVNMFGPNCGSLCSILIPESHGLPFFAACPKAKARCKLGIMEKNGVGALGQAMSRAKKTLWLQYVAIISFNNIIKIHIYIYVFILYIYLHLFAIPFPLFWCSSGSQGLNPQPAALWTFRRRSPRRRSRTPPRSDVAERISKALVSGETQWETHFFFHTLEEDLSPIHKL